MNQLERLSHRHQNCLLALQGVTELSEPPTWSLLWREAIDHTSTIADQTAATATSNRSLGFLPPPAKWAVISWLLLKPIAVLRAHLLWAKIDSESKKWEWRGLTWQHASKEEAIAPLHWNFDMSVRICLSPCKRPTYLYMAKEEAVLKRSCCNSATQHKD